MKTEELENSVSSNGKRRKRSVDIEALRDSDRIVGNEHEQPVSESESRKRKLMMKFSRQMVDQTKRVRGNDKEVMRRVCEDKMKSEGPVIGMT